jgi:uncharacterized membrane protein
MVKGMDKEIKKEIIKAITEAEKMTSGEIRVHIQNKCTGDAFEYGKKIFHKLKMDKTKDKNGVLIVVAKDSKKFAILGDKGIHEKVGDDFWNETRDKMLEHFKKDELKEGIITGVLSVGEKLTTHFPCQKGDKNELSNNVSED